MSYREEENTWVNRNGLVGLFEVEWKTPCHNILVEFLNNQKLDFEHNKIKVMMAKNIYIIDKHLLVKVLKICHMGQRNKLGENVRCQNSTNKQS